LWALTSFADHYAHVSSYLALASELSAITIIKDVIPFLSPSAQLRDIVELIHIYYQK